MKKTIITFTLILSCFTCIASSVYAKNDLDIGKEILLSDGDITVSYEEAMIMIKDVGLVQKQNLVNDSAKLKKILFELLIHKKKANNAVKLGMGSNKLLQWQIKLTTNNLLINAMIKDVKDNIKLPEEKFVKLAKEKYFAYSGNFKTAEKVHVAHILIQTDNNLSDKLKDEKKSQIEKIRTDIINGADFSTMAKQYSEDDSNSHSGGILKPFGRHKMAPSFEKAAFAMKNAGEISKVVQTRFGFHIIKLIEILPASLKPFSLVKKDLIAKEKAKYMNVKLKKYISSFDPSDKTIIYESVVDLLHKQIQKDSKG